MATKGRVEGKVVLVTGAAHGLGKADAEALAREGARVIVADIDEEEAQRVVDTLPAAMALRLDVTCEAQWQHAVTKIIQAYGRLDALVNNAGIAAFETVEQSSLEAFRRVMSVSAEGTFLGCKTCLSALVASGGGSIVNIASVAAIRGNPAVFAYSAAKGAVLSMTRSLIVHCQQQGYPVRANVVLPGSHDTQMVREAHRFAAPELREAAQRHEGRPEHVADLVLFLVSDESARLNGAEIVIDNGRTVA
ncbi:SDR family oxidoreductase [Sphingobium sp.]|uniref:SDR family oxidoreductase n=1 Tax=Sphingobium sp. TaxID=1912891 RepID=UPI0035C6A283